MFVIDWIVLDNPNRFGDPGGYNFDVAASAPRSDDATKELRSERPKVKVRSGPWRDLAVRKRPTEVDYMVGWVIGEGRRRGIAMPLNEALVRQVKELENGTRHRGLHNLDELAALRAELYPSSMGPH